LGKLTEFWIETQLKAESDQALINYQISKIQVIL